MSRSIVVFLTLLAISGMAFSIDISSCQVINSPGTYDVTASFSGTTTNYYYATYTTCILVNNTANVLIDCHGYSITETGGGSGAPVAIRNSSNVEVRNCNLNGARGLAFNDANSTDINNNNITASWGVTSLGDNYYNLLEYNTIVGGTYGLFWAVENSTIRYNDVTAQTGILTNGYNSVTDNYVHDCERCIDAYGGDDLRRNVAYNCTTSCYSMPYYSGGATFVNNTADTCGDGFYTEGGSGFYLDSNIIRNVNNGVYLRTWFSEGIDYASFHRIDNNDITNCNVGIRGYYDVYNNFTGNDIDGCTGDGFYMEHSQFDRIISSDVQNSGDNAIELNNGGNHTLANNYVAGNTADGIFLSSSHDNYLTSNTAENNPRGIGLANSDRNLLSGNDAVDNPGTVTNGIGIYMVNSDSNNLTGNNASGNGNAGISMSSSDFNRFTSNELGDNTVGIGLSSNCDFNTVTGNEAYENSYRGIYLFSAQNNDITYNDVHDNAVGIEYYWNSDNNDMNNNDVYDNTNMGLLVRDLSGLTLADDHFYGNLIDMDVRGTSLGLDYTMQEVIFDSDGTMTDYTVISLSDATTDEYQINWDSQPSALPFPMASFNNKFVEIDDTGSADTIDDIVWHWTNGELGAFDESRFQLWEYDSGWSLLNGTPDTVNNEFAIEDLSGFSTFAILAGGVCPTPITSAGTYTLTGDLSGAPSDASPIVGTTCVKIASSNVILDCDGYSITNNGTGGLTHGIVSNGTFTNVTVRNCPDISDYTRGLYYYQTSNSYILNSSAYDNAYNGFVIDRFSNNNLIEDCHTAGSGYYGFYMSNSDYNNITGCSSNENIMRGFWLQNSDYNRVVDSVADNNTVAGFMTTTSTGNVFVDSNATGPNQDYGFYLDRGGSHDIIGCNAAHNDIGFYVNESDSNDLIDVNGSYGDDGVRIESATGNTVDPSYFCDNDRQGVYLIDSTSNTISDSTMCRNGDHGIYFDGSSSNFILRNDVYENLGRGINLVDSSDGNNVTGNNVTDNDQHGIRLEDSDYNDIYENEMTLNLDGVYVRDSDYNTLVRNIASDNDLIGIRLGTAISPSSSYNVVDNNTVNSNGWAGIGGGYSNNNNITNNIVDSNALGGIGLVNESNLNLIAGNLVRGNTAIGIVVQDNSGPNTIQDNYVEGGMYGLIVNRSNATDSVDNEITQASASGIYIFDSDSSGFQRGHLYNNTVDMEIESAFTHSFSMRMDNVIFDNPAGNMTNYSNVSVDDVVESDGNHRFTWTTEPATPPTDYVSFAGKYLAFDRFFGSPVIDEFSMHWAESELTGYAESGFVLASHNGSWDFLNGTPDDLNNVVSYYGLDEDTTVGIIEYQGSDEDGGGGTEKELEMGFSSTCEANVITVKSGGSPVSGADIMVLNKNTLEDVASGSTDSDGEFSFMGCGIPIKILVEKDGYQSYSTIKTMIICSECALECGEDADCSEKEECKNNLCQRVECSCGYIEDHECISYQCCADSDCEPLQACVDNACVDHYECASDDDCEQAEYCDIAENAAAGFCEDVTGLCGEVGDHEWVQYECGDEEGCPACPEGYRCDDNTCEPIRDLDGPESGFVGDQVRVNATEAGGACVNCEVQIRLPDGKILNGKTDENGNLVLPLNLEGAYEVTLLKDGEPVETIKVNALPKPVVPDEEPDTQVLDEAANVIFLVLLLTVLLAGIIYWRRGSQKK